MSAGSIVIDLLMKTGSFETDTKRAEKRLKEFKREATQVGSFLAGAFTAAAAAVVGTFSALTVRSLGAIDAQAKLSQQLRTTYTSLETLSRAGGLAGLSMQQIGVAGRQLEVNLGRAEQGIAAQADALDKLGLSADHLAAIPLDQRILEINKALRDNVKESERAAVAADLFGARNATAIQALNAETIAEAARQTAIFGTNLSDIDAAKIEQANDAMSTFALASKGAGDQLAVAFAPVLKGLGDAFLDTAEAAGGMQSVVEGVFGSIIDFAGFTADAIEGVRRVVSLLADALVIKINTALSLAAEGLAKILSAADYIPGVDLTNATASVEAFAQQAESVVDLAFSNIQKTLEEPLPSEGIKKWTDDVIKASQEAAAATVAARKGVEEIFDEGSGPSKPVKDTFGDQIAKELQAGFSEARKYIDSTRTEIERIEQQIARVQALAADGFFAEGVDTEVLERLNQQLVDTKEKLAAVSAGEEFQQFSEFANEAARNMQDAFAGYLFNPFDEGLKGMLSGFLTTIQQMVAEIASAELLKGLFGGLSGSGNGFLAAIGGAFGGARASGGPVSPGKTYLVGERGPELFTPNTLGAVLPNGSSMATPVLNITNNLAPGVSRAEVAHALEVGNQRTLDAVADAFRRG